MGSRLAALAMLSCLAGPVSGRAQSRDWRLADRTVIGDFTRITTISTTLDRVYIVSPASVLLWHQQFQQWEGPYTPPDPAILNRVFASLADPLDNSLWLVRPDGWIHFQPELQVWDTGIVTGGIITLAFDANDPVSGLYLRSRTGWLVVARGALSASPGRGPSRPVMPVTVDEALRSSPSLQANSAQILSDPRLRTVRYTAAARSFDNLGWYLGTSGVGPLYLQDGAALPDRLTFGLPSTVVGAVLGAPDGVWAATERTTLADAALTLVDPELKAFRTLRGLPATGIPFTQVRDLVGQGTGLWAATDFGVARVETRDGRIDLIDAARGLPDSRVFAVASRQGRITVGTARGIARVNDSLRVERLAPAFTEAAYAVFPTGDTVWVGTQRGLLVALPGERDLLRPSTLALASLQAPVLALGSLGDTLVGLTRDQMLWKDPHTEAWTVGPNLSGILGRLRAFTPDGSGFWIAGDRGVAFARLDSPPLRPLRGDDLPAAANDVAVEGEFLWVATDAGLVRFRLDAVRP